MSNTSCCDSAKGTTFFCFLLGGAIGGAIGMLYAPDSGEETRRRLKYYSEEAADKVVEQMQITREDVSVVFDKVRGQYESQKDRMTSAFDAGRLAFDEERDLLEDKY
ncbi:MAG: YtxH domain-containing protein [Candidatus Lindowbacteria bacterium]|nr:YtxH domain-containing protein [Candidatus Lindowbacteria bacterium]